MNAEADVQTVISPYYQKQAKELTDILYDLAFLSESLSREGLQQVEDFIALWFQQIADSVRKCTEIVKKYKNTAANRHEEEMRWIERAKIAEEELYKLKKHTVDIQLPKFTKEDLASLDKLMQYKPVTREDDNEN
jgi:hypothetical protein